MLIETESCVSNLSVEERGVCGFYISFHGPSRCCCCVWEKDCNSTMKQCVVLMMAFLSVHGAPVDVLAPGSCHDAVASCAAAEAMNKINLDRTEGYVFSLDHLSNVYQMKHVSHFQNLMFTWILLQFKLAFTIKRVIII